jgi:histidine triad (HIT) family protein
MSCLFCKISKKEIPSEIVYEDDKTLAFLDIFPRSAGHTVVIPKFHAENIMALPDDLAGPTLLTVKKVTDILNKTLKPQGFTIGVNHGRVSGQMVDHLHIHVIPRYDGDGGGSIHSVVNNPPKESLKEIIHRIKKN